ncbi:hypothetical protein D3C73_1298150 [compost metagenome]
MGTSGNKGERSAPNTASARSLPPFTCGSVDDRLSVIASTCPPITSFKAGPAPRYGTCSKRMPDSIMKFSIFTWPSEPTPGEAKL